jgi:hypothetical protein
MKGKIIFLIVALIAFAFNSILLGFATETWDGVCIHKKEFGLLPHYRFGSSDGPATEYATGVLFGGLAKTIGAITAIIMALYFCWRNLIARRFSSKLIKNITICSSLLRAIRYFPFMDYFGLSILSSPVSLTTTVVMAS